MPAAYSDKEIRDMMQAPKPLPPKFWSKLSLKEKRGQREAQISINGDDGHIYRLMMRQSIFNAVDFSVILAVDPRDTNQLFRLCRYNGKSHEHTNRIEGTRFYEFHIHTATERYQELGMREDSFAEPTARFGDLHGAVQCLIQDCGFYSVDDIGDLFGGTDL